ncbi:hypothetical protein CAL26_09815 [Bordetella genomosp. 9]|uniref:Uncharacterized protein n=1 Tax=Bordetella genomosp. 9 TaxID=1416803 RepID=A0A261RF97_9BORD|nr:hypothetical protein [Bordetella genomosp. 9]OZI23718.1 hypothetical protein CAL26_09815 [Bordetella genomosp. 9]
MPDTPARPELPEPDSTMEITVLYTPIEIDTYRASTMVEYADAREAWARADERRKALEEAAQLADRYGSQAPVQIRLRIMELDRKEPT